MESPPAAGSDVATVCSSGVGLESMRLSETSVSFTCIQLRA